MRDVKREQVAKVATTVSVPMATFLPFSMGDISPLGDLLQNAQSVNQYRTFVAVMGSRFWTGSATTALRIFAILYVVQAAIGIAAGVAYAIWLTNY